MKWLFLLVSMLGLVRDIMGQEASQPQYGIDREGRVRITGYVPKLKESNPPPMKYALPKGFESTTADCGANSLYVFLRLHGVGCKLEDIRRQVPITDRGASMLDLKEAANKYNLKTEVVKTSAMSLLDKLPVIARMAAADNPEEGHYVTLAETEKLPDGIKVTVIDGSTGAIVEMPSPVFEREFTGYALITDEGKWGLISNKSNIIILTVGIIELFVLAVFGLRRLRLKGAKEK
jgi:hypothetical protein